VDISKMKTILYSQQQFTYVLCVCVCGGEEERIKKDNGYLFWKIIGILLIPRRVIINMKITFFY
jgi:hypothetical protein